MQWPPRDRGPARRPIVLGALAFAAVVASHHVAYRLAVPDPHFRSELLHSTGHRYFMYVAALALGTLVAGLTTFLRTGTHERASMSARFRYAVPRLLMAQIGGFLALEFAERSLLGSGAEHMLTERPVLIGVILQVLVAVIGAASLCLVASVARRLLSSGPRGQRSAPLSFLLPPDLLPLSAQIAAGPASPRGPPPL